MPGSSAFQQTHPWEQEDSEAGREEDNSRSTSRSGTCERVTSPITHKRKMSRDDGELSYEEDVGGNLKIVSVRKKRKSEFRRQLPCLHSGIDNESSSSSESDDNSNESESGNELGAWGGA